MGCQQHLPAPCRGWETEARTAGRFGDPLGAVALLVLPSPVTKPRTNQPAALATAVGMAPIAGHGVTETFGG